MTSTNANTALGEVVPATQVTPTQQVHPSTSDSPRVASRCIPVARTEGEVVLRYAPISPKPAAEAGR
jgi:hypothetical protein